MNSNTQKREPAFKVLLQPTIEPPGTIKEGERNPEEATLSSRMSLALILAAETTRHGIRELNSPLSE